MLEHDFLDTSEFSKGFNSTDTLFFTSIIPYSMITNLLPQYAANSLIR